MEAAAEFDPGLVCVWASVSNYNMHTIHHDIQLGQMLLPSLGSTMKTHEQEQFEVILLDVLFMYRLLGVFRVFMGEPLFI